MPAIVITSHKIPSAVVQPIPALLCHFDGADAATTSIDSSPNNHALTFVGNAQLDTAVKVFGSAALLLDGIGDYVDIPHSNLFDIGNNDYTAECRIILATTGQVGAILSKRKTGAQAGWQLTLQADNTMVFSGWENNNAAITIPGSATLSAGVEYHIAVVREAGGNWTMYVDGVSDATGIESAPITTTLGVLRIGSDVTTGTRDFDGHIDEIRLVDGTAVYTGPFTKPSAPF